MATHEESGPLGDANAGDYPLLMETLKGIQGAKVVIQEVAYSLASQLCPTCGQQAKRVWEAQRVALDLSLEGPIALLITVSVHHCPPCDSYFRAQPPFLRPHATYTNRVVRTAVVSVFEDGMAIERVAQRMARDFWQRPSASTIRGWCREHTKQLSAFEQDYEPFVVRTFSGVLCVDELYQDQMALLLAVDPAQDKDRLVGFQLVHGTVDANDAAFLTRLKERGVEPQQVVTDGSSLYPKALARLWPDAARQLCLFHATRPITGAVMKVVRSVQRDIPPQPRPPSDTNMGRLRVKHNPNSMHPQDRAVCIARVFYLREQGHGIRAITRMTGHSVNTVRNWLRGTVKIPATLPVLPEDWQQTPAREPALAAMPPPPAGWSSWEEVDRFREALQKHRYALSTRRCHQTAEQVDVLSQLFTSPLGSRLQIAHEFAQSWYLVFQDAAGQRRSVEDARCHYERFRTSPSANAIEPLKRVQERMTDAHFSLLSSFLTDERWQSTNNAAERAGRAFRHMQSPHYNLRTESAIEGALKIKALRSLQQPPTAARSNRGRKPKHSSQDLARAA